MAWIVIAFYLDAQLGGWHSLAAKYPRLDKQSAGGHVLWPSAVELRNGGSRYPGLTVITSQIGLGLKMPYPFRIFYGELFLPWKDVIAYRERGRLWDEVHLTFTAVPDVPVTISSDLADKILNTVGPVWVEPQPAK